MTEEVFEEEAVEPAASKDIEAIESFDEEPDDEERNEKPRTGENGEESGTRQTDEEIPDEETSGEETDSEAADQGMREALSDEELDAVADTAISILQDILKYFNVGEVTIDEYEGEEGELILDITGDDLAVLIGRHGKTLDSLQFIVSAVTVRKIGFRYPIIVDVEGYKNRQRQKLESIAHSAANRAAGQNRSVKLRPMTPYERRIVHMALRNDSRVETASEGEGSARHVVIIPQ